MKKLTYIDVVFENQEFIHIPVEKIILAQINQVKQTIVEIPNEESYKFKYTESLELVIDKSFDSIQGLYNFRGEKEKLHPITRLRQHRDVVGIIIILDDETEYTLYSGTLDEYENNIDQTISCSKDEDVVLKIKSSEIEVKLGETIDLKKDTDKFLSLYGNL